MRVRSRYRTNGGSLDWGCDEMSQLPPRSQPAHLRAHLHGAALYMQELPMKYGQRLSVREREIVGSLCEGETSKQIAERLCISPKTVEAHILNARTKLGAPTKPALTYQYSIRYRSSV